MKYPERAEHLWASAEQLVVARRYGEAIPMLQELASTDCWQLHALIGDMCFVGSIDLRPDPARAVSCYRRAIFEGDDPRGHLGLGRALLLGTGVERDLHEAERHLRLAHDHAIPGATLLLGCALFEQHRADGCFQDAERVLRDAAREGYIAASVSLAEIDLHRGKHLACTWKKLWALVRCVRLLLSDPDSPKLEGMRPAQNKSLQYAPVVNIAAAREKLASRH